MASLLPDDAARATWARALLPDILVALALGALGLGLDAAAPRDTVFYERDAALSREHFPSTVPTWLLGVLAAAVPLAGVAALALARGGGAREAAGAALAVCHALAAAVLATNALKVTIGSKRPNFFALCDYGGYAAAVGTHDAASGAWALYANATLAGAPASVAKCRAAAAAVKDGMKSFPSGHASLSFAGLVSLALAARGALRVRAGDFFSPRAVAAAAPAAVAAFVAASRVTDNWHREVDVAVGAAIGTAAAVTAWRHAAAAARLERPAKRDDGDGARAEAHAAEGA